MGDTLMSPCGQSHGLGDDMLLSRCNFGKKMISTRMGFKEELLAISNGEYVVGVLISMCSGKGCQDFEIWFARHKNVLYILLCFYYCTLLCCDFLVMLLILIFLFLLLQCTMLLLLFIVY
jgi:hypothetical protein